MNIEEIKLPTRNLTFHAYREVIAEEVNSCIDTYAPTNQWHYSAPLQPYYALTFSLSQHLFQI